MSGDKHSKTIEKTSELSGACLDRLYGVIESRRGADPTTSHTANLFHKGRAKIAQKVGEEAIETVIEAMRGDKELLLGESADLLYHLLVLWADCGIKPDEVWTKLLARDGVSGIAEKAARSK
jgi:phosphoribosyl-ATP pyrophosphohydrolase